MDDVAALRKQLETCEDFTKRREIRRKIREIEQNKNGDSEPSGRSSRTRRREEHTEEITTTSSDGVTITETHKTKTEIVENGDVVKSEEKEEVSTRVEDDESTPEVEAEPEPEAEPELEAEPEPEPEPEAEESPAQEEESENVPPYMQKNPEDLTEQDIQEIDDLDFLETTLNQLPIKFFDVRKHLRARIRNVKVNQGANSRQGQVARSKGKMFERQNKEEPVSRKEKSFRTTRTAQEKSVERKEDIETRNNFVNARLDGQDLDVEENTKHENGDYHYERSKKGRPESQEEFTIEKFASDTLFNRLDEPDITKEMKKEPEVYSEDEDGSSLSSPSATSSMSDMENPPAPSDGKEDPKTTKEKSIPAHKLEPLEPGKKKTDFQSQLKKTGFSPRLDLSHKKKDQQEKIDLRKNLKSVPGASPLVRRGSWSEKYGPSLKERPSKRAEEEPPKRQISSAELFELKSKPIEQKPAETKQTTLLQTYKYEPPKIVETKDEKFESVMAQRKKSSSRHFNPADLRTKSNRSNVPAWSPKQLRKATYVPPMPGARKLSAGSMGSVGSEGSDSRDGLELPDEEIDEVLNNVDVENLEDIEIEVPAPVITRPTRKMSSGNIKWVQGPQINIQDKNQLSALRQQIEHEKKEKEGGGISTTTTKTTETRHDGRGGSSTFTKTTTTTRGGSGAISGRGGIRNFEAEMAKKKKERQSAKAQAFKSAKDKRSAFKDQLEASNPKPAGGVKKSFGQPNTAVNALLEWCRRKTRGYENVEIQNYTTSWANGMAMCALFHNFSPNLIPWETLDPKDRKRNWTLAFDAAYAEGMDPILELEDVLSIAIPEPRSLITYIHSIYQHFHDKAEKAKAEKEQSA